MTKNNQKEDLANKIEKLIVTGQKEILERFDRVECELANVRFFL